MSQLESPVTAQLRLYTYCLSPGTAAVAVAGEVDMATAPALHAALLDALNTHSPVVLDVDLSACTFLACAGLTVLVRVHAAARAAGCQMWATHPRGPVRRVLEVTGLLDVFTAPCDAAAPAVVAEPEAGRAAARRARVAMAVAD
jgi:anti-sigma B factor antagonist